MKGKKDQCNIVAMKMAIAIFWLAVATGVTVIGAAIWCLISTARPGVI